MNYVMEGMRKRNRVFAEKTVCGKNFIPTDTIPTVEEVNVKKDFVKAILNGNKIIMGNRIDGN